MDDLIYSKRKPSEKAVFILRIRTILVGAVLFFLFGAVAVFSVVISAALAILCIICLIYTVVFHIPRYINSCFFYLSGNLVFVEKGFFKQLKTSIPMFRIQYVELVESPLQRAYKVCNLVIHTAGSRVTITHVDKNIAEILKDEIEANILRT